MWGKGWLSPLAGVRFGSGKKGLPLAPWLKFCASPLAPGPSHAKSMPLPPLLDRGVKDEREERTTPAAALASRTRLWIPAGTVWIFRVANEL